MAASHVGARRSVDNTPTIAAEKALAAVIHAAYVHRVSTRSMDKLVKALGMGDVSKSEVSRLCGELDERVQAFLDRPIEGDWPYLWICRGNATSGHCSAATCNLKACTASVILTRLACLPYSAEHLAHLSLSGLRIHTTVRDTIDLSSAERHWHDTYSTCSPRTNGLAPVAIEDAT